jgi:hypothetical protein
MLESGSTEHWSHRLPLFAKHWTFKDPVLLSNTQCFRDPPSLSLPPPPFSQLSFSYERSLLLFPQTSVRSYKWFIPQNRGLWRWSTCSALALVINIFLLLPLVCWNVRQPSLRKDCFLGVSIHFVDSIFWIFVDICRKSWIVESQTISTAS